MTKLRAFLQQHGEQKSTRVIYHYILEYISTMVKFPQMLQLINLIDISWRWKWPEGPVRSNKYLAAVRSTLTPQENTMDQSIKSRNVKKNDTTSQPAHGIIMSLYIWRQNDVTTWFWRHNDVIFASCVRWVEKYGSGKEPPRVVSIWNICYLIRMTYQLTGDCVCHPNEILPWGSPSARLQAEFIVCHQVEILHWR